MEQKAELERSAFAMLGTSSKLMSMFGNGMLIGNGELATLMAVNNYQGGKYLSDYLNSSYDNSKDYWKMLKNGQWEWDNKLTFDISEYVKAHNITGIDKTSELTDDEMKNSGLLDKLAGLNILNLVFKDEEKEKNKKALLDNINLMSNVNRQALSTQSLIKLYTEKKYALGVDETNMINKYLNQFNSALYSLKQSGIVVDNQQSTLPGLVNERTSDNPFYFPLQGDSFNIRSDYDFRFVHDAFADSQNWPSAYPSQVFNKHWGSDLSGNNMPIAASTNNTSA